MKIKSLCVPALGILLGFGMSGALFVSQAYAVDPAAYWKFDEGVGTSATDSSGNGYTGTISGATYSTTTPPEIEFENPYSLEFDGVNDGVTTSLSLNNYSEFTLAGWAYPRSASADEGWFGANDVFEFIFLDSTTLRCWTGPGAVNWSFEDDEDFLNNWHHITCLGDGDSVSLYVDGEQVASTTHDHVDSYGTGDNFTIGLGVQNGGSSGPFDGLIDDVRVYASALTPQEMFSLGTGSEEPLNNPVVTSFSPANNATDVALDADLELTFNMEVGWESGNILIKKAEDDSTAETIPIGGGPISGSGTDTLSIDPQSNFEYDTEYYIEIPDTAVRDITEGLYFAGISGTSTWSFTTEEDDVAPIITESVDIPDLVTADDDGIYYFQTNEVCEIQATEPTSTTGPVSLLFETVDEVGVDIGGALDGMQLGGTYSFSFICVDEAGNESNRLTVGPYTVEAPAEESSSGSARQTSITQRVKNLQKMGNSDRAEELKKEYSHLFETTTGTLNVRDLELTLTGPDVKALQQLLNAQGYLLAETGVGSIGNETEYFGTLTQNALIKYQSANGISPSAGYFGPITRAQMKSAGLVGLWW